MNLIATLEVDAGITKTRNIAIVVAPLVMVTIVKGLEVTIVADMEGLTRFLILKDYKTLYGYLSVDRWPNRSKEPHFPLSGGRPMHSEV